VDFGPEIHQKFYKISVVKALDFNSALVVVEKQATSSYKRVSLHSAT